MLVVPALGLSTCDDGGLTGMWVQLICPDIDIDQARLDVFDPEAISSGPLQTGWVPASPLAAAKKFTETSSESENQLWVLILVNPKEHTTAQLEGAGFRDEREVAYSQPVVVTFERGRIIEYDTFVELTHQGKDEDADGFYVPEDCDDNDPDINPEAQEVCDGLDNNCNGTNDEGCACPPGETRPCWPSWEAPIACPDNAGCGCAMGTQACDGGLWSTCEGVDFRDTEGSHDPCPDGTHDCYPTCSDNIDNDCDGMVDMTDTDCGACEVGTSRECPEGASNVGLCRPGISWCGEDGSWGPCEGHVPPEDEQCDQYDHDCDTESYDFEEDCPLSSGACAQVPEACVCAGMAYSCDQNGLSGCGVQDYIDHAMAAFGVAYVADETTECDGFDNDCDGDIDEWCDCSPNGATQPYGTDVGACESGVKICEDGQWVVLEPEVPPATEVCDGVDGDCDDNPDDHDNDARTDCQNRIGNRECVILNGCMESPDGNGNWACAWSCTSGENCYDCNLDLDDDAGDGCEYACTTTAGYVERCDGLDNDCDCFIDAADAQAVVAQLCPERPQASVPSTPSAACIWSDAESRAICQYTCIGTWADCNSDLRAPVPAYGAPDSLSNGCEADTSVRADHCGACFNQCSFSHGDAYCYQSTCRLGNCDALWDNCDGTESNGCETSLQTLTDCGSCGNSCSRAHATASCSGGSCHISSCDSLWDDCDGNDPNGCETSLETLSDCGSCNTACTRAHATASCSGGSCHIASCNSLWDDCDGSDWNGCETSLETLSDCGSCNTTCSRAHATASCSGGSCHILSCNSLWDDCDGTDSNGCETSLETLSDCGSCDASCSRAHATASCSGGSCHISSCDSGWGNCDGTDSNGCEHDVLTDPLNCGGCGTVCNLDHVATHGCSNGNCTVSSCDPGYDDCNGTDADGCEINLTNDPLNCNGCGNVCDLDHTNLHGCSSGSCTVGSCDPGWGDCDGVDSNGCEINTNTNPSHCGGCGNACNLDHVATHGCSNGNCTVVSCDTGYRDCNGVASDGCEVYIDTDPANCGGCGNVCNLDHVATHGCSGGNCTVVSCDTGYRDCNGTASDGCEININTDPANCGGCGTVCNLDHVFTHGCSGGDCTVVSCDGGWDDCDGTDSNGCETELGTDSDCSACDDDCSDDYAHAAGTCDSGSCAMGSCTSPWEDCNTSDTDGCEAEIGTDAHCSACYDDCTDDYAHASGTCDSGSCAMGSCSSPWEDCNTSDSDGCEAEIGTDAHCSACYDDCTDDYAHASGYCDSGSCAMGSCDSGYDDCSGGEADGCETDITSNPDCGSCFNDCGSQSTNMACVYLESAYQCGCTNPSHCAGGEDCIDSQCQ